MKKSIFSPAYLCKLLLVFLLLGILCAGCGLEETDSQKLEDVSYTILEEKDIPQEFLSVIEEKKEEIFKLTYTDQENLYIAVGYGAQQTGGYSIAVNQCYLTKNAIYFDTTLMGPSKGEKVNQAKSYPYLVIRTKYSDKSVVFE
ncbi:MAG: protease complex subunit PrcB family protein [Lachnospiraceae bacterium]|nr:protease complex subunit PrcB family protein [Lachnospiraceae bacterium]